MLQVPWLLLIWLLVSVFASAGGTQWQVEDADDIKLFLPPVSEPNRCYRRREGSHTNRQILGKWFKTHNIGFKNISWLDYREEKNRKITKSPNKTAITFSHAATGQAPWDEICSLETGSKIKFKLSMYHVHAICSRAGAGCTRVRTHTYMQAHVSPRRFVARWSNLMISVCNAECCYLCLVFLLHFHDSCGFWSCWWIMRHLWCLCVRARAHKF